MPGEEFMAAASLRLRITRELLLERMSQHDKYGVQRHRDRHSFTAAEFEFAELLLAAERQINADPGRKTWQSILLEQVQGAFAADELPAMRAELIKAAAVLVAWIEDIDTRPTPEGDVDGR